MVRRMVRPMVFRMGRWLERLIENPKLSPV